MHDTDSDEQKTGKYTVPSKDSSEIMRDRDAARFFVHSLLEAAKKLVPEREWSAQDLLQVLRFAEEGGPAPTILHDGQIFKEQLNEALERAERYEENFSIMIVTMDGQQENELLYGSVVDGLVERLRRTDKVFVFKGRAAILLPYTSGKDLSTLKSRIENLVTAVMGPEVAIGIEHLAFPSQIETREEMIHWVEKRIE